jgi:hypothetical protein
MLSKWLHDVSSALHARVSSLTGWDDTGYLFGEDWDFRVKENMPHGDVIVLWCGLLREAMQIRHGGAFAVVPSAIKAPIDIKFPLAPHDLGGELIDVWKSHCSVYKGEIRREIERNVEDKRVRTHRLLSARRCVAALSATDGCVVIDRELVVRGFGGSIKLERSAEELRPIIHLPTGATISRDDLLRPFGERHKSAYYLCHQVPNSIVFVLSQEGDLRVFASDDSNVYFAENLHP